ncbi:MAG TPA: hypothetical protein VLM85_12690 [Polyangiaceae bacterium]|nr:hypothetical protein [Polyangiaceae bacterium]
MTRHIVIVVALAAAACGGPDKPANSASADCPPGTQKQGGDCVAPDEESGPGKGASLEAHGKSETGSGTGSSSGMATSGGGGGGTAAPAGAKTPYDKDAVEIVLRRAANQVKANCGAATDSDGKRLGPWGATKVSVTLGRNGHVRDVSIPSPYDDKPAGSCAIKAFENLIFPPYAAPTDSVVDWDVELVKPK